MAFSRKRLCFRWERVPGVRRGSFPLRTDAVLRCGPRAQLRALLAGRGNGNRQNPQEKETDEEWVAPSFTSVGRGIRKQLRR